MRGAAGDDVEGGAGEGVFGVDPGLDLRRVDVFHPAIGVGDLRAKVGVNVVRAAGGGVLGGLGHLRLDARDGRSSSRGGRGGDSERREGERHGDGAQTGGKQNRRKAHGQMNLCRDQR